ncbi:MAG: septum formation family protein [Frankiaceae bacterium]|nr:septum formation family protein [Frankiaceae bacterium]
MASSGAAPSASASPPSVGGPAGTQPASIPPGGPAATSGPPAQPLSSYPRERENLTPVELAAYANLHQGDCLSARPPRLPAPVAVVDCAQPHTDQVMGFVDLSEGTPDIANIRSFQLEASARCNLLRDALSLPAAFAATATPTTVPDATDWANGVRAALCWVPVGNSSWSGSAIDGSASFG